MDDSGPNIVRGGTHGQCRRGESGSSSRTTLTGAKNSAPDGRVSRAAAEARSGSGRGGEAAAPTSGVPGPNQAPRNRSEAEIPRSRRRWAYDGVSPTGARRDRPSGRPDEAEGGKRRHRSGAGAITYKVGGASFSRRQPAGAPQARSGRGRRHRRELALGGDVGRGRVAAVEDRGRRAGTETETGTDATTRGTRRWRLGRPRRTRRSGTTRPTSRCRPAAGSHGSRT